MAKETKGLSISVMGLDPQKAYAAYTAALRGSKWFGKASCKQHEQAPEAIRAGYTVKVVGGRSLQRVKFRLMSEKNADYSELVPLGYWSLRPKLVFEGTGIPAPRSPRKRRTGKTPIQSIHQDQPYDSMTLHLAAPKAPLARFVLRVKRDYSKVKGEHHIARPCSTMTVGPRTKVESQTGPYATRWRIKGATKWKKPVGLIPEPTPVDQEILDLVNLTAGLRRWKAAGYPLPILANRTGGVCRWGATFFELPQHDGTVYHTTTRSILTPQIKAAVMAVYGVPLPRSPLLPR